MYMCSHWKTNILPCQPDVDVIWCEHAQHQGSVLCNVRQTLPYKQVMLSAIAKVLIAASPFTMHSSPGRIDAVAYIWFCSYTLDCNLQLHSLQFRVQWSQSTLTLQVLPIARRLAMAFQWICSAYPLTCVRRVILEPASTLLQFCLAVLLSTVFTATWDRWQAIPISQHNRSLHEVYSVHSRGT